MSTEQINALAAAALLRLRYFINRMHGQQVRRMREAWAAADAARADQPTTPTTAP